MSITAGKVDVVNSIPPYKSKSEDWIQWHKDLKSNFGNKIANTLWLKAWGVRGTTEANTSDLRKYMTSQGVKIDESKWDSVVDLGVSASDSIGTFFQAGKYVGIALGVIVIGGLAMVVYNLAKSPAKNIGVAAKAFV